MQEGMGYLSVHPEVPAFVITGKASHVASMLKGNQKTVQHQEGYHCFAKRVLEPKHMGAKL